MSRPLSRAQHQRPRRSARQQQGVALLVAILLVALGTIIAAAVAYENAMTARRGTGTYAFDQSLLIGEGAEALAAYGLRQLYAADPKHIIYRGQGWDKTLGPIEVVPGVMLEASLDDLQGRFNLNNLVRLDGTPDEVEIEAFRNLLETLHLEPKWAGYLVDWIDEDNNVASIPEGAEDNVYTGQTPPYRPPNRYITSASELLALPGFGLERYRVLAPYVTALPHPLQNATPINVCTAPGKVLDAFIGPGHQDFGGDEATLQKNRLAASACFPTLDNYKAAFNPPQKWTGITAPTGQPRVPGQSPPPSPDGAVNKFGMSSSYFRLTSFITIGSTEFNLYSLLYQDGRGTGAVRSIQRSFTPDELRRVP
jgi:general secretion pathway protein K